MRSDLSDPATVLSAARTLWLEDHRDEALSLVARALKAQPAASSLRLASFAYGRAFQQPIKGRRLDLIRRGAQDAAFLRKAWSDRAFMDNFHRQASALPQDDGQLVALLERERRATLLDARNLHWTMVTPTGDRIGMASLVEIALQHGRAELVVGAPGQQLGAALEATLLLLEFAFGAMRLHKVSSVVYGENRHALRSTLHLGFTPEGVLRDHMRDPATGQFVALHLSALFRPQFLSETNQRLAQRVLRRPLAARPV